MINRKPELKESKGLRARQPKQIGGLQATETWSRRMRPRYRRKPRAVTDLSSGDEWRFSFCCAVEGCRRRTNPPSVRFLGRRVYLGVLVVLVSACCQGMSSKRVRILGEELGVDRRTLERWRVSGIGPTYLKLNGRILYRLQDIEDYEEKSLYRSTSNRIYRHIMADKVKWGIISTGNIAQK